MPVTFARSVPPRPGPPPARGSQPEQAVHEVPASHGRQTIRESRRCDVSNFRSRLRSFRRGGFARMIKITQASRSTSCAWRRSTFKSARPRSIHTRRGQRRVQRRVSGLCSRLPDAVCSYAAPARLTSIIVMSSDCRAVPRKRTTVAMIASSAPAGSDRPGPAMAASSRSTPNCSPLLFSASVMPSV